MPKEKINKTNACRILDQRKIAYELIPYEVDENDLGAQHIADQLGEDIDQVFKTFPDEGTAAPNGLYPWRLLARRHEEAVSDFHSRDLRTV